MTDASPIFCFVSMEKDLIIRSIEPAVNQRGCFIVDISLSRDNDIVLTVEKEVGEMDLEDCVAINDAFLAIFDKDAEDYSLTVSSAGLDQPFKVGKQFQKAIGSSVSVLLKGGRKLIGVLTGADQEGISLRYSRKELQEGKKKKVTVEVEERFGFGEVNSVIPYIEFKK